MSPRHPDYEFGYTGLPTPWWMWVFYGSSFALGVLTLWDLL